MEWKESIVDGKITLPANGTTMWGYYPEDLSIMMIVVDEGQLRSCVDGEDDPLYLPSHWCEYEEGHLP